LNNLERRNSL